MRTKASGQSALLLLDIIDILNRRHTPYAIVGAFAASFYGVVRASLDADAVISVHTSQDAANLCKDFGAEGLTAERRWGNQDDPIGEVINIQDRFHNRVDLLIGIRGMTQEAFHRLEKARFMDCSIKVIGREDFIAMKIFAGSSKDILDVIGVLNVSGEKIDLKLLKKLTAQYGADCAKKLQALLKEHRLEE